MIIYIKQKYITFKNLCSFIYVDLDILLLCLIELCIARYFYNNSLIHFHN